MYGRRAVRRGHASYIEINDEQEDFTRPWLEGSPYADKIKFYIGDALELVPRLGHNFDLAFVDGDKRKYTGLLRDGSYLPVGRWIHHCDNTLWDGHVLEEHPHSSDLQTIGIKEFNDFVARDSGRKGDSSLA